jgi:hypothetical protein
MGFLDPIIKPFKFLIDAMNAIIDFICKCKLVMIWFSQTMNSVFCYIKIILFCPMQYFILWFFMIIFAIIRSIIMLILRKTNTDKIDFFGSKINPISGFDSGTEKFLNGYKSFFGECFVCAPIKPFPL